MNNIKEIMKKNDDYRNIHKNNNFIPKNEGKVIMELFSDSNLDLCTKKLNGDDCQIIKSKWKIIQSRMDLNEITKNIEENIYKLDAYHLIPSNILTQIKNGNFNAFFSVNRLLDFIPINFFWYIKTVHEFIPLIDVDITNILEIIKLFRYYNLPLSDKEISKFMFFLNNISQKINFVSPNTIDITQTDDLIPNFTLSGIPTIRIDKSGYNKTINQISEEIITEFQRINLTNDIDYRCPNFGAEYVISQTDDDYVDNFENTKKNFTLDLDRSGSYNIVFSIPCDFSDINRYKIKNIKSLYILQILEPIIYSIYSSCDPRSVLKDNFTEGSYVLSCILLKDYEIKNESDIFNMSNNKNYIESLKTIFSQTNKFKNLSMFQLINDNYIPFLIKFKFWDNFNHKYIDSFLKIISLIICHDYKDIVEINEPWENDFWKETLGNILVNGWTSRISKNYCDLVESSMGINLNITDKVIYPQKILETIVDILFNESLDNGLYWHTVRDKKNHENKPKITNVNRLSWEVAFRNIDSDISLEILLKFKKNNKYELETIKNNFINTKWHYNIEEILEYLVAEGLLNLEFDGNQKFYHIND